MINGVEHAPTLPVPAKATHRALCSARLGRSTIYGTTSLAAIPRLLLLDEVRSALDPELVGEVLHPVRELAGQGMTILMATHEMGFAREVADTVCFLDGGVVPESGPAAQVLAEPHEPRTRQFLARVIEAGRL